MKLTIATCQFPVSADIRRNLFYIKRQILAAKDRGAVVVHFPEGAISGYAGIDFASYIGFDWPLLKERTEEVLSLAGELRVWIILGSSHRLRGANKPHNSLYIRSKQLYVDQLQQLLGKRELLAGFLRAPGWGKNRAVAVECNRRLALPR